MTQDKIQNSHLMCTSVSILVHDVKNELIVNNLRWQLFWADKDEGCDIETKVKEKKSKSRTKAKPKSLNLI